MAGTATQLTDKFRKDVEKVSKDKVQGAIVQRLRAEFAPAPGIRAKRSALLAPAAMAVVRQVSGKKKRK